MMTATYGGSAFGGQRLLVNSTNRRWRLASHWGLWARNSTRFPVIAQSSRAAPPESPKPADQLPAALGGRDLQHRDKTLEVVLPQIQTVPASQEVSKTEDSQLLPKVLLLFVALLWGSYAPSVRLLYSAPNPPDATVVMAVRGVLQAGTLLLVTSLLTPHPSPTSPASPSGLGSGKQPEVRESQWGEGSASWQEEQQLLMQRVMQQELRQQAQQQVPHDSEQHPAAQQRVQPSTQQQQQQQQQMEVQGGQWQQPTTLRGWFDAFVNLKSPPLWMAAVELGFYNYTATALQTFGLQLTSATRASFLIQATLVFTPLLSMLAGYNPGRRTWAGCLVALGGTLLITADEVPGGAASAAGMDAAGVYLGGDAAVLLGALFYSLVVVRISAYARSLSPAQIATGKSVALGGFALCTFGLAAASLALQGRPVTSMWEGYMDPFCWAVLLWSGVGPGALGSYLHVKGQRKVAPAEAQVIFSSKPLWSAGLAWVLLGGEELGPLTWVGGGILVVAGILASTGSSVSQPQKQQQEKGSTL